MSTTIPLDDVKMVGYERVETVAKTSYTDNSCVVVIPSRGPFLHTTFYQALQALMWPMNQKRAMFFVHGAEVGRAYDEQVEAILAHPDLGKWKYVLTIEDDTVPPPDGTLKLFESIEQGPYDGVGGMYFTKGQYNMPQIYGDPIEYAKTGVLDFRPRDPAAALKGGAIVECNGIAMGFSLYRMDSLRKVPGPRFQTLNEYGVGSMTQDLFYCAKARKQGQRFAVDCRVRCAHYDWESGIAY